jgi:NAD(P)-dependent dehydrogenase (short-subunit alcohol dehydrogenase family)
VSKTALITGASGGIGYELALLFARDRFDASWSRATATSSPSWQPGSKANFA